MHVSKSKFDSKLLKTNKRYVFGKLEYIFWQRQTSQNPRGLEIIVFMKNRRELRLTKLVAFTRKI